MALLVLLLDVEIANACPTCKDTLGLHAIRMQYGYALSIGFMMLGPFSILGEPIIVKTQLCFSFYLQVGYT